MCTHLKRLDEGLLVGVGVCVCAVYGYFKTEYLLIDETQRTSLIEDYF